MRNRTDMSEMTEEEKLEHRKKKNREKAQKWRAANPEKHRAQVQTWQNDNPEKIKAYQSVRSKRQTERLQNDPVFAERRRGQWREWAIKNQSKRDTYKYKRTYGITYEERDALLVSQGNKCAICEAVEPGKVWHTDHDHATGVVRGILCHHCNTMLGLAKDNLDTLRAAIAYLTPT